MRVDFHMHVAGVGAGGTGCWVSPRRLKSSAFRYIRWQLGISWDDVHQRLDDVFRDRLMQAIDGAGHIDVGLVYAHDRIYDRDGHLREDLTEIYTPNDYVIELARRHAFVCAAASVHPYRPDALDELHRTMDAGARAMKWLPNSQGMDPADRRLIPFYDALAARKIPLISHTGGEHTVSVRWRELGDPRRLTLPLDRGVTVIAAHCGSKSGFFDRDWFADFADMARTHPNFYGDTSGMAIPNRSRFLVKILREEGLVDHIVHGSDFPVPPLAWSVAPYIGWKRSRAIAAEDNWVERDYLIKSTLGFPEAVFTRGAALLGLSSS